MARSKEDWIKIAKNTHQGMYEYSLLPTKITTKDKIIILCPEHGEFKATLGNHVYRKSGCPKCAPRGKTQHKPLDMKSFLYKAKEIHRGKYDYSNVVLSTTKEKIEIICLEHGSFFTSPSNHLYRKSGCPKCGIIKAHEMTVSGTESFITKAKEIHGGKYDYSLVKYVRARNKVEIICKIHGVFLQRPNDHLTGYGCLKCGEMIGGLYSGNYFTQNEHMKNIPAHLYFINFFNEHENFYKIGITKNMPTKRFRSEKMIYGFTILNSAKVPLEDAFFLEQEILSLYKNFSYAPKYCFGGHTECLFLDEILKNQIIEMFSTIRDNSPINNL